MVKTLIMRISPWVLWCLVSSVLAGACSNADKSEKSIMAEDLPGAGAAADGQGWETAPFPTADDCAEDTDRWLRLERRSKSEGLVITHELGRPPSVVLSYTSESASGCGSTVGAGDAVVIDYVDEDKVKIHNNTDTALFVRLVLL